MNPPNKISSKPAIPLDARWSTIRRTLPQKCGGEVHRQDGEDVRSAAGTIAGPHRERERRDEREAAAPLGGRVGKRRRRRTAEAAAAVDDRERRARAAPAQERLGRPGSVPDHVREQLREDELRAGEVGPGARVALELGAERAARIDRRRRIAGRQTPLSSRWDALSAHGLRLAPPERRRSEAGRPGFVRTPAYPVIANSDMRRGRGWRAVGR